MVGGPEDKPAFLDKERAEAIGYVGAHPDAIPTFDEELAAAADPDATEHNPPGGKGPSRGYIERWRAIARYHALGKSNNWICGKLGYSPTAVSLALNSVWVRSEVDRYRSQYETDIIHQVKEAATDGVTVIHEIINNDREKSTVRLDAAKWAVEKTTGKARQEINVESGTFSNFMEMLKGMQQRGETLDAPELPVIEITANPAEPASGSESKNQWDAWLKTNI